MKRPYQITGLVFLVFSGYIVHEALGYRYLSRLGPGPGFFPLWVAAFLGLMGAVMFLQATLRPCDPMPEGFFPSAAGYRRMAAIILALVSAIVLMEPLGFRLTVFAFLGFLLAALGRQRLVVTGVVALAGSVGVYYVFVEWLRVPLPIGMLGI